MGDTYRENPRDLVQSWAASVVQLWSQCRGEFGLSHLPDAGGMNDQAGWLIEAFNICWATDAELRQQEKEYADHR